ncbi:hypothetical protein [Kluyvera intermedia]|uniref:hypothetical protein n=1 Tax=Kluyvera intermedia TaxID=61648 RepID=UPI003B9F102E
MSSREQFEAWVMTEICISKSTLEGLRTEDGYRNSTLSGTDYNRMWNCWQAASKASEQQLAAVVAENAGLKSSRAVLSENALEACNAIASAGFRHEAIMRGLYASTGNGNKYPKPIATLVDEALREVKTPATDAYLAEVRTQGVEMAMEHMQSSGSLTFGDCYISLNEFAAQLRQGAAL